MRLLPYFLNLAYSLLLVAVAPVIAYRSLVLKKYRTGWSQKLFGNVPLRSGDRPCFWFHAVSVGEVLQLPPLIAGLSEQNPDLEFVISTTTHTGYAVAQEKFPGHRVCYYPLDFSWAVRRALKRIRPAAVVLVEMELWPNFVLAADQLQIPLSIINGRLSEKSFRGYRRLRFLVGPLLNRLQLIAVQTAAYAERFADLAGRKERIHVTGSIKFDGIQVERDNPKTRELRDAFQIKPGEVVLVAGSTQDPEERIALDVFLELQQRYSNLRLILVPRHQERFEEVARLVKHYDLPLIRRSYQAQGDDSLFLPFTTSKRPPICLLDTLGELKACWGLADFAFVGGSLTRRGGQNMIEPAGYGAAVAFGPNTWNFKDVVAALIQHRAAVVVQSQDELQQLLTGWLENPAAASEQGIRAQDFVLQQRGATQRTADLLLESMSGIAKPVERAA